MGADVCSAIFCSEMRIEEMEGAIRRAMASSPSGHKGRASNADVRRLAQEMLDRESRARAVAVRSGGPGNSLGGGTASAHVDSYGYAETIRNDRLAMGQPGQAGESRLGGGPARESLLQELGRSMRRAAANYLGVLMRSSCGQLPGEVRSELENEVRAQLRAKVDSILSLVIRDYPRDGAPAASAADACGVVPGTLSYTHLEQQFRSLQEAAARYAPGGGSAALNALVLPQVDSFCRAVLQTSELRQEVEPLVALLVTYATARLKEGS